MEFVAKGMSAPHAGRLVGISKDTAYAWANGYRMPKLAPPPDPSHSARMERAVSLRMMGLSLLAVASSTGLTFGDVLTACEGVHPSISLPDLPGLKIPYDIAPPELAGKSKLEVVAEIRKMRAENYSTAAIAKATGVHASTVAKYAPAPYGQSKQKCTPETVELIRQMRKDRYALAEIAKIAGVGIVTVSKYAPPAPTVYGDRRRKVTPEMHASIRRMYHDENMSYAKIASLLGLSEQTVIRYTL